MGREKSTSFQSYDKFRILSPNDSSFSTPLSGIPLHKELDRFQGCLVGGAVGDALGYPVEFLPEPELFTRFGATGITSYALKDGTARISDDTQMTLFTANGLLFGTARGRMRGIMAPYASYLATAYREWYKTQISSSPITSKFNCSWLLHVPELYAERSPGDTCMGVLGGDYTGTPRGSHQFQQGMRRRHAGSAHRPVFWNEPSLGCGYAGGGCGGADPRT